MKNILDTAIAEIGNFENPTGSNSVKYNDWIYNRPVSGSNYPWCGSFVSWVYDQAGFNLGYIDVLKGFVGVPAALKHFSENGELTDVPKAGDIVIYDWTADGSPDHVGIFESDLGNGYFSAIEGNTALGNDSHGGMVMRRQRLFKPGYVWFVRPGVVALKKKNF